MQIGFINFSQEELAKKNKVLQMVRDQTAIDELGFGRIRDAFANLMFPGMSTLQRRAKYFAVMPSMFYQATQKKYSSWREVRDQIVRWEIRLTEMLMAGAGSDDDKNGITGSSVLAAAKKDSKKFVKYDPTYIYMSGLRTFGMVKSDSNIYRLIYERSKQNQEQAIRHKSTAEEEMSDSEDRNGLSQFFSVCDKYDFDNGKELPLNLTLKEAKYLKEHIETSIKSTNSLLAYILRNNIEVLPDYDSLGSKFQYLPEEFRIQYQMGRTFSHFAYVVQLRYNHIVATFNEQTDEANDLMREIESMLDEYSSDFTTDAVNSMLMFISGKITESTVISFCKRAIKPIEKRDWNELDELIVAREKAVKPGRNKLRNPKCKGEERLWPRMMSFRWDDIVYQVINEIREAK
ncbi:MAG: hypothetical protein IKW86_09310 [Salinivirgaceae bacterium]|nr:hypothetical protein [Salinivirgaceae bacterium]